MTKCIECGEEVEDEHFITNVCERCTFADDNLGRWRGVQDGEEGKEQDIEVKDDRDIS